MATWNAPVNVINGDNLSALLWNNQLGASGSLQYLYDTQNTVIANTLSRNVILRKSTNTVLALGGNSDIAFDTIMTYFTNDQLNFPITTPVTAIPFPQAGVYMASFTLRYSVAAVITVKFTVSNGTVAFAQANQLSYVANGNVITSALIPIESSGCTLTVNILASAAGTATAAISTSTADANMQLRLVKITGQ